MNIYSNFNGNIANSVETDGMRNQQTCCRFLDSLDTYKGSSKWPQSTGRKAWCHREGLDAINWKTDNTFWQFLLKAYKNNKFLWFSPPYMLCCKFRNSPEYIYRARKDKMTVGQKVYLTNVVPKKLDHCGSECECAGQIANLCLFGLRGWLDDWGHSSSATYEGAWLCIPL